MVKRELLMGLCLGGMLALAGYACASWVLSSVPEEARERPGFVIPTAGDLLVIPITLIMVVMFGTLCGGVLPMLFRRMGLDPALMSNPFVAGIIDIAGIVIYMNVALLLLSNLG